MSEPQTENNTEPMKEPSFLPFPPGKLTTAHKKELIKIRTTLISWLLANADADDTVPNSSEPLAKATKELSGEYKLILRQSRQGTKILTRHVSKFKSSRSTRLMHSNLLLLTNFARYSFPA